MTKAQRIKFFGLWNRCSKFFQNHGNYTKSEVESERQEMLRLAGARADKNGRYSANTLTNDGISTCLDFMETSILGKLNKKRRSKSIIWTIEQLKLDEPLLNKVSNDTYKKPWRDLTEQQLTKFRYTATRIARQQNKQQA